ncbi:MAG: glycosyltransferase family 2 protein [Weeksellaceae bacterium]
MSISVIIPAYKKKQMFLDNLRHNLKYLKNCEIIVVNDDPSESLMQDLATYPQVTFIEHMVNKGFSGAINTGVAAATGEYLFLLNTDVKLRDTSYLKAMKQFDNDSSLFAVSFAQIERDGSTVGKNRWYWKDGFVYHSKAADMKSGITAWAEGGSSMISKQKFVELHGLDEIYAPFYSEDADLSYRAWKAGYSVLFNDQIVVEHHHESTIGSFFDKQKVRQIALRNQILFVWKNITVPDLLREHTQELTKLIFKHTAKADIVVLRAWLDALARKSQITKDTQYEKNDRDILNLFK